jgi:hydroxymethylbilane synthase
MVVRLATRGSPLARWQADWVAAQLRAAGYEVELVIIATAGDKHLGAIDRQAGRGLFTKEIQAAVLDGRADLTVHSLKDLPTENVDGLVLAAVPQRGAPADALLSVEFASLDSLPQGAIVGTGSLRRRAQLLHARGDLAMADLRGNVDTRIRKLEQGDYQAIVLAEAGLRRLGLADRIRQVLSLETMLPAVGQAALGIEAREDDRDTLQALAAIDHGPTHRAVLAERALLDALDGGCLAPIAAYAQEADGRLTLQARVLSADGQQRLDAVASDAADAAERLGREVAGVLLARGAAQLIAQCRA